MTTVGQAVQRLLERKQPRTIGELVRIVEAQGSVERITIVRYYGTWAGVRVTFRNVHGSGKLVTLPKEKGKVFSIFR